jgi:hypothetical protein
MAVDDDRRTFCCQNDCCPDYGKRGHGNLTVCGHYGPHRRLLYCRTCKARDPADDERGNHGALDAEHRLVLSVVPGRQQPRRRGKRGRTPKPVTVPPEGLTYATVHKTQAKGRGVKVAARVVYGSRAAVAAVLGRSQVSDRVNTVFVERYRHRPQPRRLEGAQDLLLLEGLGGAGGRDVLYDLQLPLLRGGADAAPGEPAEGLPAADAGDGRRTGRPHLVGDGGAILSGRAT